MILILILKCEIRRYTGYILFSHFKFTDWYYSISLNHLIHNLGIGDIAFEMKSNWGGGNNRFEYWLLIVTLSSTEI